MKAPKSHAYNNLSGLVRDIFSTSEMHEGIVSGISLRITKATIIACTAGFALSATVAVAQDSPLTENPFINSQLEGGTELFSTVIAGAERTPIPTRVSIKSNASELNRWHSNS